MHPRNIHRADATKEVYRFSPQGEKTFARARARSVCAKRDAASKTIIISRSVARARDRTLDKFFCASLISDPSRLPSPRTNTPGAMAQS
jgi:hypothetical protein